MELSESVQRGLRSLADLSSFDQSGFQVLLDASFRSLLSSHADPAVLGELPPLPPPPPRAFVSAAASGFSRRLAVCGRRLRIFNGDSELSLICSRYRTPGVCTISYIHSLVGGAEWRSEQAAAYSYQPLHSSSWLFSAACLTFSSSHTITRPLGIPFVIITGIRSTQRIKKFRLNPHQSKLMAYLTRSLVLNPAVLSLCLLLLCSVLALCMLQPVS